MNFAEEENDCKVFIVKPSQSVFAYGSSQQQGLHTVTGEFFEVGTPREEREEPKGLGPPYKLNPAQQGSERETLTVQFFLLSTQPFPTFLPCARGTNIISSRFGVRSLPFVVKTEVIHQAKSGGAGDNIFLPEHQARFHRSEFTEKS